MIQDNDAVKLEDGTVIAKHKVEIYCPNCNRDVGEAELVAQKCNDCGHDLSSPKQSVTISATPITTIGAIW